MLKIYIQAYLWTVVFFQILDELLTKWEEMGYQFRSLDQLAGAS